MHTRFLILSVFSASLTAGCTSDILDGYRDAGNLADASEMHDVALSPTVDASARDEGLAMDAYPLDVAMVVDTRIDGTTIDVNLLPLDTSASLSDAEASADAGLVTASITATLLALQGGEVPLGSAMVHALKGSVATDKTIVLSSSTVAAGAPNAEAMRGLIYSVEPADLIFDAPIELTLPIIAPIMEGQSAFIAAYDEASKAWIGLPTKWNISSTAASVLVTHGGKYAVFSGAINAGNVARSCPATVACGGTLLGAFTYASSCTNVPSSTTMQACGSSEAEIVASSLVEGNISFFSGGSFSSNTRGFTRADVRSNAGCTSFFKSLGDLSCSDLASRVVHSQLYTWSCSGTMNDRCFCSGMIELAGAREELAGEFTITNNGRVTLAPLNNGLERTVDYCVEGTSLTLRDGQGVFTAASL